MFEDLLGELVPWLQFRRALARIGAWLERREVQHTSRLLGDATRAALLDRQTFRTPRPLGDPDFQSYRPDAPPRPRPPPTPMPSDGAKVQR